MILYNLFDAKTATNNIEKANFAHLHTFSPNLDHFSEKHVIFSYI